MTRRSFRHVLRYPVTMVVSVGVPVLLLLLLLLFVGVFGGAIKAGLGAVSHGSYINYVMPGIIVMTAAYGSSVTAIRFSSSERIPAGRAGGVRAMGMAPWAPK